MILHSILINFSKLLIKPQLILTESLMRIFILSRGRNSNLRHRPIGLGVQGLADAYIMMRLPFESEEAKAQPRGF